MDKIAYLLCLFLLAVVTAGYYFTISTTRHHRETMITTKTNTSQGLQNEAEYGSTVWDYVGSFWSDEKSSSPIDPEVTELPSVELPEVWTADRVYAVVIDAGSSGSRAQIYSWKSHLHSQAVRKNLGLPMDVLPAVERGVEHGEGWQFKQSPGISTFGTHPKDVGQHIKPLLDFALSIIPENAVQTTPVYLMATAGMRLLPSDQQEEILKETCIYIRAHYSFALTDCANQIQVISGEIEGIYGWVAVNYLMGGFDDKRGGDNANLIDAENATPKSDTENNRSGVLGFRHTYGFLDMGGASTQIAFEPSENVAAEHWDDLTTVRLRTLAGREIMHRVFVTTFLGYGTNEARRRYVQTLKEKSTPGGASSRNENTVHEGSNPSLDALQTSNSSAVENTRPGGFTILDPCLPSGLTIPDAEYDLQGDGSFEKCLASTLPLLNKDAPCLTSPCLFNGVHTPSVDFSAHSFVGISEYWYSSQDIFGLGGVYDFYRFETEAAKFCATPWMKLSGDLTSGTVYHKEIQIDRLQLQCFKAAWIANMLHTGLGVPRVIDAAADVGGPKVHGGSRRPPLFQSVNTIKDIQVSWTLGAVLLHAARDVPNPSISVRSASKYAFARWTIAMLIFSALVVVLLWTMKRCCFRAKEPRPMYTSRNTRSAANVFRRIRMTLARLVAPKGTLLRDDVLGNGSDIGLLEAQQPSTISRGEDQRRRSGGSAGQYRKRRFDFVDDNADGISTTINVDPEGGAPIIPIPTANSYPKAYYPIFTHQQSSSSSSPCATTPTPTTQIPGSYNPTLLPSSRDQQRARTPTTPKPPLVLYQARSSPTLSSGTATATATAAAASNLNNHPFASSSSSHHNATAANAAPDDGSSSSSPVSPSSAWTSNNVKPRSSTPWSSVASLGGNSTNFSSSTSQADSRTG